MHPILSLPALVGIALGIGLMVWGQQRYGWIPPMMRPAALVAFLLTAGAMLLLLIALPAPLVEQAVRLGVLLLALGGVVVLVRGKAREGGDGT